MEKNRKKSSGTTVLLRGVCLSMGIYLAGIALLALLAVRGTTREELLFPAVATLCFLAALAGTLTGGCVLPLGRLPSALAAATCFAGILPLTGLCIWGSIAPDGRGAILILCTLAGGTAAGLTGTRRKPTRKRK